MVETSSAWDSTAAVTAHGRMDRRMVDTPGASVRGGSVAATLIVTLVLMVTPQPGTGGGMDPLDCRFTTQGFSFGM